MNLTLIGMSGAGKSYIGRRIAERLGLEFLDLDVAMEEEYGKSLPEILEALGDERFIEAEAKTAIEKTGTHDGLLISTGGSIIYSDAAMRHLAGVSRIVYLDVPYEVIDSRVGGSADRLGRIVGIGSMTLRQLYDSRVPLYEKHAHYTLEPETHDPETVLGAIAEFAQADGERR